MFSFWSANKQSDPRDEFISRVVRGRSFVDVGGLWGTVNERVSIAHQHGANSLAMIDVSPSDGELWSLFEERRRALKLPDVQCVSGDVLTLDKTMPGLRFDVVHCSGVLYHMPDPVLFLAALHRLTTRHLILTSSVTATTIRNKKGVLEMPGGAVLFIPGLQTRERSILKSHWEKITTAVGLTTDSEWNPADFGPWWWLPTVESLKAMCMSAGFRCIDGAYCWNNNAYTLLLSVVK
jgi:hypothetical protein